MNIKTKRVTGYSLIMPNYPVLIETIVFVFILFSFSDVAFSEPINLPRTGQTLLFSPGDDGNIQAGSSWPYPRFTDNKDGTITDNLTGLMWIKDGSCLGISNWEDALSNVEVLNLEPGNFGCAGYSATYNDWRLPNINEIVSLLKTSDLKWLNQQGFVDMRDGYITSTTVSHKSSSAWSIQPSGIMHPFSKHMAAYGAWAVRGKSTGPSKVWRTGQTTSFAPGDDGSTQEGQSWPIPRFLNNGDATITDKLTGLMWMENAGTPSIGLCTGGSKTWQEALEYVACLNSLNHLGHSDWRLPNRKEFESITDFSKFNPILPDKHPFINVHSLPAPAPGPDYYWTSTTHSASNINGAWACFSFEGGIQEEFKSGTVLGNDYVWPVRGGTIEPAVVNDLVKLDEDKLVRRFNSTPVPNGPAGTFSIMAIFTNTSSSLVSIFNPFFRVLELSGGNLLLNADVGAGSVGSTLTLNLDDDVLSPGESVTVDFTIAIQERKPFTFLVDLLGDMDL